MGAGEIGVYICKLGVDSLTGKFFEVIIGAEKSIKGASSSDAASDARDLLCILDE